MAREMKDSGIAWIGEIPEGWKICRLKNIGHLYGGLTGKSGDDFNVDEGDVHAMFIPFTNIFNNSIIDIHKLQKVKIYEGESQNSVINGDLLFLMSSEDVDGIGKCSLLKDYIPNLYLNSFCKGFRIYDNNVNSIFLNYLMSSHILRELIRVEAKGFIRINLRQDKLACCPIFLPSFPEQRAIADYLDKKCGEIDELISLQEKMIEELKAYKQSVITEAVTKGLNPDVPMKDSGIEWIGEIPISSKIVTLKKFVEVKDGTHDTPNYVNQSYNTYPLVTSRCIINGKIDISLANHISEKDYLDIIKRSKVSIFDIIMPMIGTVGNPAIVLDNEDIAIKNVALFKMNGNYVNARYLQYFLNSNITLEQFLLINRGGVQNFVSQAIIKNLLFILPLNIEEIVNYLDNKCSEIDSLIALKQKKIEELKEYKKSMIYEYVTGKKEV